MPHFFINSNQINNNIVSIKDKENYIHIARALRARAGEKLLLIDENSIQYETVIENITNSEISAKIENQYLSKRCLDFDLYLAQSPLRSDAQNLLIEKATELGVKGIYPLKTDNCALNTEMINKKIPKWQKIMYEASKQCERANIPTCFATTTIKDILNFKENSFDKIYIFCERIADRTIRNAFAQNPIISGEKVLVVIGPEGGFSPIEFEIFKDFCSQCSQQHSRRSQHSQSPQGVTSGEELPAAEMLTLGNLILKADTAVVAGLGNIIYEYSTNNKR